MKRTVRSVFALVALALLVAGCSLFSGDATISGTMQGYYFSISSDVLVTISRGGTAFSVAVPVTSTYDQSGAFAIANLVPGDYAVEIAFEAGSGAIDMTNGATYSVDGGAYVPVDDEVVTGSAPPYVHTVTIDSLAMVDGLAIDIYFGDVE